MQNLKENWLYFQKWHEEFGTSSLQHIWKTKNWDFYWVLSFKVQNVWAKNLQGSYVSWQWRMIQNLKRNWLVSSKLTWGIWRILTQALENLKNLLFNWLLWPKYIMFELKNYRGVMFDGTKDWCKIWRKTDLWFLKWHKEFGKFWFTDWKIAISF